MRLMIAAMLTVLATLGALPAWAEEAGHTSEIDLVLPNLSEVTMMGTSGPHLLLLRPHRLRARPRLRPAHLHAAAQHAGAQVDARDQRADLRDLQDLPDHAGQVHPDPRAVHRHDHGDLLRLPARHVVPEGGDHHPLQSDRHRRQLHRRLVRHPHQHVRQLAHRLRRPRGPALPLLRDSAQGRHEHRHAAHLDRAAADADGAALHPLAIWHIPASSASPSANRSAPRRCASPAASSPRSPTSARI